jgi:hypothetical protein
MPVILATQEAEKGIMVWSQPRGQIVHDTLSWKNPSLKRAGGVAQGLGPEFKPQYCKQKKKEKQRKMELFSLCRMELLTTWYFATSPTINKNPQPTSVKISSYLCSPLVTLSHAHTCPRVSELPELRFFSPWLLLLAVGTACITYALCQLG